MNKHVLIIATVPSMIGQFNMDNIKLLQEMGYVVDVACDFNDISAWPQKRIEQFKKQMSNIGVNCFQIDFSRNALNVRRHVISYKEVKKLIKKRNYLFIHTHTPIASAVVRLAAYRMKTKVIYTAHGFHFYKGAPILNWLLFYPIEKWLSKYTEVLITINKEDYKRAKKKFRAKKIVYVPGVGIDTGKFNYSEKGRKRIREELGLDEEQIMILSVGELNKNKNHESVIKAIHGMNITYVIVGKGELKDRLDKVARNYNVDLRLMGYRNDIVDFYSAADVYVLPSIREGLNVSLMEAMACGLAVSCGNIRGNVDLVDISGGRTFNPSDLSEISYSINSVIDLDMKKLGENNKRKIKKCDCNNVKKTIKEIYIKVINDE